jgi:succinyl-CoA synthetase alpha subunit
MSILIDGETRLLVQGMTGRLGRSETERMLAYGTRVVAGVTPGKGGTSLFEIPVYDTVAQALVSHDVNAVASFVPARVCLDAALEVIDAGIPLLTISAERIPQHDVAKMLAAARRNGVRVVGPNTQGIASPGRSMIGGIGGLRPDEFLMQGNVGVVSKSGGMGGEICWLLTKAGIGQSTYVSTGGELMLGTTFRETLELFESDQETHAVVLFGEAGSTHEVEVAEMVASGEFTKPLLALITGRFAERMPGVTFGHGGTIINDRRSTPSAKEAILRESGVTVLRRVSEIVPALSAAI